MKKEALSSSLRYMTVILLMLQCVILQGKNPDKLLTHWPDGTKISGWFADTTKIDPSSLGRQYVITGHGVTSDSTLLQTEAIQRVIDLCTENGGGVIVIPNGTFLSGALFFKQGTHLHFEKGGRLKGIDDIRHYPLIKMHMEGKMIDYFAALVTAEHCSGFTISGEGVIDGNGQRFWDEFWIRRKQNPKCTNLEALRPQLVYITNSNDVTIQDVHLINSPYWTTHLYRTNRVRIIDCTIKSPAQGTTHAPSTDAVDLDICNDVMIRGCNINICDDGICMKGGKGTFVDHDSTAGAVNRVLVENCYFGNRTNAGITFGSEAWMCRNVIMNNCHFYDSDHALLFKMRPDTPQTYEHVLMTNCSGSTKYAAIEVSTWTQFYNPEERPDKPESIVNNVTMRNLQFKTSSLFRVQTKHKGIDHQFRLNNFTFDNIKAKAGRDVLDVSKIEKAIINNVIINGVKK